MTIWFIFALMTGAAVLAVLWPLSRRARQDAEANPDTIFYRDQLAEIARDEARGLLSPAEAEAARAEAGRRLLRATAQADGRDAGIAEPALRRRRAAQAIALSTVPLLALAAYGALGRPSLPAQPLASRMQADPGAFDLAAAVNRIETHLAQNPNDARGWEVLAPVYVRAGRFDEAVKAFDAVIRIQGETAERLADRGEAMVARDNGMVSADARRSFSRALELDPKFAKARFYMAQASEQDGNKDAARKEYETILAQSDPNAPWLPLVNEQVARLDGKSPATPEEASSGGASATAPGPSTNAPAAAAVAALPPSEREAAIRGMVQGLAARLESDGGSADEWQRLIRSYMVLGEQEKAKAALVRAQTALAEDPAAVARIGAISRELGLAAMEPRP